MAIGLTLPLDILIAESSATEARRLTDVLHSLCPNCHLHVAPDGRHALNFLRREPGFEEMPAPSLVLLDLSLPVLNGFDVLAAIKTDQRLRLIPVVVFTEALQETEILRAYDLYANSVLIRPTSQEAYLAAVRSLERFWCHTALLPTAAMTTRRRTS